MSAHERAVHELGALLSAEETVIRLLSRVGAAALGTPLRDAIARHELETHRHVDRVSQALRGIEGVEQTYDIPSLDSLIAGHDAAVTSAPGERDRALARFLAPIEEWEIDAYERTIRALEPLGAGEAIGEARTSLEDERRMLADMRRLAGPGDPA